MATMMLMEWPGITKEQYDRVMSALGFDKNPPKGGRNSNGSRTSAYGRRFKKKDSRANPTSSFSKSTTSILRLAI